MIYKATPIRAHRVDISAGRKYFIPTNGFSTTLSDLRVLSHFNEDQSMMHQYPSGNYPSSFQTMNMPPTRFCAPFMPQVTTAEHHGAPSVNVTSSSSSYDSPYMPSHMSPGGFGTATKSHEVSSPDDRYRPFSGSWPASPPIFHPPMLVPLQHYSSSPAPSPISSVSPGPSPRKQELQIRLSQPCYEMGQRHHEIIPLETGPFKK